MFLQNWFKLHVDFYVQHINQVCSTVLCFFKLFSYLIFV